DKVLDGEAIRQYGLSCGWSLPAWIYVFFKDVGRILVGLVISYAGGIRKGFIIVFAFLVLSRLYCSS
ncbi:hypothetical protein AG4045_020693, partial [Apium graveolens]